MDLSPLSSIYVSTQINKFYQLNGKLVVNASVFLQQMADTTQDSFRAELQQQLTDTLRRRNNNIGLSRLFVDGPFSPGVQGLYLFIYPIFQLIITGLVVSTVQI